MLYLEDIDDHLTQVGCQGCGDGAHNRAAMILTSRCHPKSGSLVVYQRGDAALFIVCKECRGPVTSVAVASRPPEELA